MRNHHIKGFSLVEILIVIAVIGIIAGTGMIYTTNTANLAKISNEYTHLIQLIKKYSMVSEKQSEPMLLEFDFSNNDTQTMATLKKYKDSSYKRLSSTDCEDLDITYQEVVALNKDDHIFENVRILICPSDSSSSLTSMVFVTQEGVKLMKLQYFTYTLEKIVNKIVMILRD